MNTKVLGALGKTIALVSLCGGFVALGCESESDARPGPGELERVWLAFNTAFAKADDDIQGNCDQRCPGFATIVDKVCGIESREGACDRLCDDRPELRYPTEERFVLAAFQDPLICGAAQPKDAELLDGGASDADMSPDSFFIEFDAGGECSFYASLACECADPMMCPEAVVACTTQIGGVQCSRCVANFDIAICSGPG